MNPEEESLRKQEDQKAHKSSVDRVNDLVNKARTTRNYYKRAKNVRGLLRTARTAKTIGTIGQGAATAAGAVSTSEVWVPVGIIALILFIIIMVIIILTGGRQGEIGTGNVFCSGTCQATACVDPLTEDTNSACEAQTDKCCIPQSPVVDTPPCDTIDQMLLSTYGVKIKPAGEAVSCEVRQKIYNVYSIPTRSPRYYELLKPSAPFTLEFRAGTNGRASGYTPTAYGIQLTGFASFISNDSWFNLASFLLIHETGHLIRHRNSWITSSYPNSALISSDSGCYSAGYLKTYSRAGSNRLSENIAEGSALYVYNSKSGNYGTISNFSAQCDQTHSWMKNNIYGDTIIAP